MVKDRLPELQACRSLSLSRHNKGREEPASLDSSFLDKASSLFQTVDELRDHVMEIEKVEKDILAYPQLNAGLETRLNALIMSVKQKAFAMRSELKGLEQETSVTTPLLTSAQDRAKSSQFAALTRQFMEVMNMYNSLQLDYREKCKLRIRNKLTVAGSTYTEEQIDEMLEKKNPEIFTQAVMSCTDAAKRSLSEIEARHADILRLEKNIEELRDLFVTMALTVDGQSQLIDRIEYNVEKAVDCVEQSKRTLSKARIQQTKNRRRKTICIIILFVLALFVIIIIASAIGLT